jgi:uncharacterized RmlC-like cupin family protein
MPMTLPETYKKERAKTKYHEYTDTKVSSYISVVFGTSHVFFGNCMYV